MPSVPNHKTDVETPMRVSATTVLDATNRLGGSTSSPEDGEMPISPGNDWWAD